jgi:hypothetical protein
MLYNAARVVDDQLDDILCNAKRITNGDNTHIAIRIITTG